MSTIRLSCKGADVFVPEADGTFVAAAFSTKTGTGYLTRFERPDDDAGAAKALNAAKRDLATAYDGQIKRATAKLAPGAPVAVMVHGFLFDPTAAIWPEPKNNDNPHGRVFHYVKGGTFEDEAREHSTSWPLGLDFRDDDQGANGVVFALGWYSRPGLAKSLREGYMNHYSRAYDYGRETGWVLACVIAYLAGAIRNRPIDIVCHSLGAVVVVRALAILAKREIAAASVARVGRVVIMGGSEYSGEAQLLYRRLDSYGKEVGFKPGEGPYIYNIVSRENDVLDFLAENFGPKSFFSNTQVIGHNGLEAAPKAERWIDLQIDARKMRQWAGRKAPGYDISGDEPGHVWDHWYYYTWPGNMAFYKSILRDRAAFGFDALRAATGMLEPVPEGVGVGVFGD